MGYNGVMSDSQHTDLLPAYLAVGEDALKREAVIARLKARLGTMGDMAFNSDEFDGESAEGAAIAVPEGEQAETVGVASIVGQTFRP